MEGEEEKYMCDIYAVERQKKKQQEREREEERGGEESDRKEQTGET